jgi:hypothetical protein
MALLDEAQPQYKSFGDFLGSDEAMALAAGLLAASGPSQIPISFGQALGAGLQNMQAARDKRFDNVFKQAQIKNLTEEMKDRQVKREAQNRLMDFIAGGGQNEPAANMPSASAAEPNPVSLYPSLSNMQGILPSSLGAGILSSAGVPLVPTEPSEPIQTPQQQSAAPSGLTPQNRQLAGLLAATGNIQGAIGLLNQDSSYGAPIQVMRPDGKVGFAQVNKGGQIRYLDDISPVQKGGTGLTANGNSTPTPATQSQLQQDITTSLSNLKRMDSIKDKYVSSYLTYAGQARAGLGAFMSKAFNSRNDANFVQGRTKFVNDIQQLFNQYRKEITGAAAAVQELDRLKASMLNEDMSPLEFEAAYSQFRDFSERALQLKQQLIREGIPVGSAEFGQRMDESLLSGGSTEQATEAQPPANTPATQNTTALPDPLGLRS